MPRQASVSVENNFSKGLITEATGLNFPENACTETYDCVFDKTGEVSRRLGIQLEDGLEQNAIESLEESALTEFLWKSVSLSGERTFFVMQRGSIISFWAVDIDGLIAPNLHDFYYNLNNNKVAGAPDVNDVHASFAAGNGSLYVAHPYCTPVQIIYDDEEDEFTVEVLDILVRDMSGVVNSTANDGELFLGDPIDSGLRPTNLSSNILYNLFNQGWDKQPTFRLNKHVFGANTPLLKVWRKGVFNFPGAAGGAFDVWQAKNALGRHDWPSEADMWTVYKRPIVAILDDDGNPTSPNVPDEGFALDATDDEELGNSPAPKGSFIYGAFRLDRWARALDTATHALFPEAFNGLTPMDIESSGYARPSQIAFYAGRVWYAGVDANKYNTRIYFSWIVENNLHSEKCYQRNDPTAADGPSTDLLPSDGGVVVIPDIARVIKLIPYGNSLLVFGTNGIWQIAGSAQGAGFNASDYGVVKIASVGAISFLNFADADGTPLWWNSDGIYSLKPTDTGMAQATSLTNQTIQTFYDAIPVASRRFAKGVFNFGTKTIQWLYRSTAPTNTQERYHYDRILNLDLNTGAMYPWTISDSCLYVAGITVLNGYGGALEQVDVTDDAVIVTDDGDNVTDGETVLADITPRFKYVTFNECDDVDPGDEEEDGIVFNQDFLGHLDAGDWTSTAEGDPATNGILIGEDGKFYTYASNGGVAELQRYDGTGSLVSYSQAALQNNITTLFGTGYNSWEGGRRIIPVPFSPYYYYWTSARSGTLAGTPTNSYTSILALFKIDSGGNPQFITAQSYLGRYSDVGFVNQPNIICVDYDYSTGDENYKRDIYVCKTNNTSIIEVAQIKTKILHLPSVEDFTTAGGTQNSSWSALYTAFSEQLSFGSDAGNDQGEHSNNTVFMLPSSTGVLIGKYVSYAQAQWHLNPANVANSGYSTTIGSYAATYPNGFVITSDVNGGAWTVANSAFKAEDNGALIPFDDLGLNKDGSMGDPDFNDWMNPTHQYDEDNNTHYVLWTRRYENIALNQTALGSWRKVLVQIWNPSSQTATFVDSEEGYPYDTLGELEGNTLYGSYPKETFAFFNDSFDKIYVYSRHDSTYFSVSVQYTMSQFADFSITVTVPTTAIAFSEFTNSEYMDWPDVTIGYDYDSYFISGYKLRGEALRKFQSNYWQCMTRNTIPSTFDVYGRWDYANSGNTGRWNSVQRVTMDDTDYLYRMKRLKMRGHGKALQFKVNSVTGEPFNLVGWSMFETTNAAP